MPIGVRAMVRVGVMAMVKAIVRAMMGAVVRAMVRVMGSCSIPTSSQHALSEREAVTQHKVGFSFGSFHTRQYLCR